VAHVAGSGVEVRVRHSCGTQWSDEVRETAKLYCRPIAASNPKPAADFKCRGFPFLSNFPKRQIWIYGVRVF
jgi:hypothetical protein